MSATEERERYLEEKAAKRGTTLEEARRSTAHKIGFWGPIVLFVVLLVYGCIALFR